MLEDTYDGRFDYRCDIWCCSMNVNFNMRSCVSRKVKETKVVVVKNKNTVVTITPILNATNCRRAEKDRSLNRPRLRPPTRLTRRQRRPNQCCCCWAVVGCDGLCVSLSLSSSSLFPSLMRSRRAAKAVVMSLRRDEVVVDDEGAAAVALLPPSLLPLLAVENSVAKFKLKSSFE